MHADRWRPIPRCWVGLFSLWLLAGCATGGAHVPAQRVNSVERKPTLGGIRSSGPPHLILAASGGPTSGEPPGQTVPGYNVPGRNSNSQAPWEFFLGNAAHRLIAYMYGVNHPTHRVFYNTKRIVDILAETEIGETSRLLDEERNLRPDITDVTDITASYVFEIKPWNAQGLQEGRQEVQIYLAALNRAAAPVTLFTGGMNFQGQILIRFAQGQYIWRLEWQTPEPGVTQYRWTRSRQRFESERAAYEAGQWVDLTVEEFQQYGGWVGQAVEGMVTRREQLATVSGAVGIVIDIVGETARGIFTGVILGRMGTSSGAQQPPAQGGGKVIPFPPRPIPSAQPPRVPQAVGK